MSHSSAVPADLPRTPRPRRALIRGLGLLAGVAVLLSPLAATPAVAATDTRPMVVAVFGDSTNWGQGVRTSDKYATLFGQDLQARTGRPVQVVYYAHSGSPLAFSHPGYDAGTLPQGWGSCDVGYATPSEIPVPTPSVVECQIPRAAASGLIFDVALISGCGVDVGVLPTTSDYRAATNLFTGSQSVTASVDGLCSTGLAAAVTAAHALPGAPKVVLNEGIPPISRLSIPAGIRKVQYLGTITGYVTDRFTEYASAYAALGRRTLAALDPAGSWSTFVPTSGTERNAIFAPESAMWIGFDDQLFASRTRECKPYLRALPTCPFTSIAHPNLKGQQIMRADLNASAAIQSWFPPSP